ncbi:MAG TPA: NAD(P)-dependent oxidoreductase [Burkholderiales bacterium]|nr:NAD(P)-dependent oxidoreductase [Burkholderiales bacterium]
MTSRPQIAWIGAGRMGVPMAGFVLTAGYPVAVYSRSAENRRKLVDRGAREAASVADCVRAADIVFTSLPDDAALRSVALGPDGVLAGVKASAVFADTSTVSAQASGEVAREAAVRGIAYLRMPISGNAASAQRGEVTAMASGPQEAWQRIRPVVQTFSSGQTYLGGGEEARYMKLVVNALVVNFAQTMAEAFALGRKAGLDWNLMLDTIAHSTIASPWLKTKIALLKPRDFTVTMSTRLIMKDLDLMLAAAREHDVPMPLTAVTRQLMQAVAGAGYAEEDYMAAIKVAEAQSGLSAETMDRLP